MLVECGGNLGVLEIDFYFLRFPGQSHEPGGRIDVPTCSNRNKVVGLIQRLIDFLHVVGHFPKPHDVGADSAAAPTMRAGFIHSQIQKPFKVLITVKAENLVQPAVHVQQVFRPGPAVKVVDVLGDQKEVSFPNILQLHQGGVGGVWVQGGVSQLSPSHVVKALDQGWISSKSFRCGDVLDAMVFPKAVLVPERANPAFCRDSRACEDDYILKKP